MITNGTIPYDDLCVFYVAVPGIKPWDFSDACAIEFVLNEMLGKNPYSTPGGIILKCNKNCPFYRPITADDYEELTEEKQEELAREAIYQFLKKILEDKSEEVMRVIKEGRE